MTKKRKTGLTMLGYEGRGSENLSLRLVAGAAEQAGFAVSVCTARSLADAPGAVAEAISAAPTVLGLVLQEPHSSLHTLALAELARKRGYAGYIVCAGEFAALQPGFVLERAPSVDGVIRHSGGTSMVALLSALDAGEPLSSVSCLWSRELENPPGAAVSEPFYRAVRGERPTVMGIPTAEVMASRGCDSHCAYCTHAAVADMAVRAALRGGASPAALRKAGAGGVHRRDLDDLADEMAALYHDNGVRHFGFADENVVPGDEAAALAWAGEFKGALLARDVTDATLGFMTRADAMTEPVADALVDLGLIRTLAGVESGYSYGLASLGRGGNAGDGRRGIRRLVERNVVTLFNDIIFHPASTVSSIRDEIQFLRAVRGALFDTVQAAPYIGTPLGDRMAREGRLWGGRILPAFTVDDPVLDRFRNLLTRLQTQAFGAYNPTLRANDLLFSAALAVRHGAHQQRAGDIAEGLDRLAAEINRARVDTLQDILDTALSGGSAHAVIESARERFAGIIQTLDRAEGRLRNLAEPRMLLTPREYADPMFVSKTYLNFAAAAALVFVVSGTSGCKRAASAPDDSDGDMLSDIESAGDDETARDSETIGDSETHGDTATVGDSATVGDTATARDTATAGDSATVGDTEPGSDTTPVNCNDTARDDEASAITNLVYGNCDTFTGVDGLSVTVGPDGKVESVSAPEDISAADTEALELIDCVQDILMDEAFPCLTGEAVWISLPPLKVIT